MNIGHASGRGSIQPALLGIGAALALAVALLLGIPLLGAAPAPTPAVGVIIPDNPVFSVAENKPNVLMVLDNSNSMDESASGAAVGSNSPDSKSQIARGVVKKMLGTYSGRMSVGLMAYKQSPPIAGYLHNSPYDVSYNPSNYDPSFAGSRASTTKRYRQLKPGSSEYVYYNIALPFYSSRNEGTLYCYSGTASFDNGSERYPGGPWDTYGCYSNKSGSSDGAPGSSGAGYTGFIGNYAFSPTDSDLAQNILDFGRRMASYYVSRTWYVNDSPGRGYLHTPIKPLDATQAALLSAKLDCNIPDNPAPCTDKGIINAGLTPMEGTLLTAKDYFAGSLSRADEGYTATTYPLPVTCAKNYVILLTDGMPSTDKDGAPLTDPAAAITKAAAAAAALKASGVATYVIGFALPVGVDASTLDKVAAAGGTGTAYSATDQASLDAALTAIFAGIDADSGSSGATTTNTTGLSTDTRIFKASFNPSDWSGALQGYPVIASGVGTTPVWTATIPAEASRKIYTWNGSAAVEFKWGTIPATQQSALGTTDVVSYLRGNRSLEGTASFRTRSSVLGDIVYSAPAYMKEAADPVALSPAMEIVAVGANDGMLHIFDGQTGVEKFAYVPAGIDFAALKSYTTPGYLKSHKYFVDGQIAISSRVDSSGKNILVGTLGRGGRGAFALDVTDADAIKVLWDKTGAAAPDGLGYVLGAPFISKVAGSGTSTADVVFMPNGITRPGALYDGKDQASLFVLNAVSGTNYYSRIDAIDATDTGSVSNGLSSPRGWDADGDGTVDYVYAGDIRGNVWKFDLTKNSPSVGRFFLAQDSLGKRQPITGGISVSIDLTTYERWIHFGTGQFFNSVDFNNRDVQTLYGVKDEGLSRTLKRADLQSRAILSEATAGGGLLRFLEPNAGLATGKSGWYIDLVDPTAGAEGERVTGTPQEVAGQLRVSSGIPGANACKPAGGGFIYILDAFSGTSTPSPVFDANGDGKVDDNDKVGGKVASGTAATNGLAGDVVQTGDVLTYGGSENRLESRKVKDEAARGRVSWREIIRD